MAIFGDNRIEVQDEKGYKSIRQSSHVKYVEPSEKVVQQLPGKEMLQKYGRSSRVLLTAKDIPDLPFNVNGESEFPEHSQNSLDPVGEVMEVMEANVCPQNVSELFTVNLQSSDNCEQSGNSLKNVVKEMLRGGEVGVALEVSTGETTLQGHRNQQLNVDGTLRQSNNLSCSLAGVALRVTEMCGESHKLSLNLLEVEGKSCLQTNQHSCQDGESEQGPGIQESPQKKMTRQQAKCRKVNNVLQTEGSWVEVIPVSLRKNRQTVLVTMYLFLDFHGLKMCQNLLV